MIKRNLKGQFVKGFTSWNKGRKMSESFRKNNSKAQKGKKLSEKHKRKIGLAGVGNKYALGYKHTEQAKRKMSEMRKGNKYNLGRKLSVKTKQKLSKMRKGKKCYNWKGGITPKNHLIRNSIELRLWREKVFTRDNWTCQKCQAKSGNGKRIYLHSHHIYNFADYLKLRFVVSNGITFCEKCHREFHQIYKYKNNKEQLKKFLSNN